MNINPCVMVCNTTQCTMVFSAKLAHTTRRKLLWESPMPMLSNGHYTETIIQCGKEALGLKNMWPMLTFKKVCIIWTISCRC